jgi:hypothetical protein
MRIALNGASSLTKASAANSSAALELQLKISQGAAGSEVSSAAFPLAARLGSSRRAVGKTPPRSVDLLFRGPMAARPHFCGRFRIFSDVEPDDGAGYPVQQA